MTNQVVEDCPNCGTRTTGEPPPPRAEVRVKSLPEEAARQSSHFKCPGCGYEWYGSGAQSA